MKTKAIRQAAILLKQGSIGIFPTETVYGLGANALDPQAVLKVYQLKERPRFNPLIVHIYDIEQLNDLVKNVSPEAKKLMRSFWPGALTLVFEKRVILPDIVTSGLPTVGIRMPSHPIARALLKEAQIPIAAPSANFFQRLSPTRFEDLDEKLLEKVDFALPGGDSKVGVESTILQLRPKIQILRAGGISKESIEKALQRKISYSRTKKIVSPGQLKKHYSPITPLYVKSKLPEPQKDIGVLTLKPQNQREGFPWFFLSKTGSLTEAAANLFSKLKELDRKNLKKIIAIRVPQRELGVAINDRLKRASHKKES